MVTKRKLNVQREAERRELSEDNVLIEDPTARPRWRRHTKSMEAMLDGIDPDRFERLAFEGEVDAWRIRRGF